MARKLIYAVGQAAIAEEKALREYKVARGGVQEANAARAKWRRAEEATQAAVAAALAAGVE